ATMVEARPGSVTVASATRHEAHRSGLIGTLEIPTIDLSVAIVEGTGDRQLRRGVGHVTDTAFPGEASNVGLAAHRDTYFRKLGDVKKGDRIIVHTPDGRFDYRVVSTQVVMPTRGDLLDPTKRGMLTLVTCYPFYYVGPAPKRFVIRARSDDAAI